MHTIRKTAGLSAAPGLGLAALLLGLAASPAAYAQGYTLTTLVNFTGDNGAFPQSDLKLSADGGTLYGTTEGGGINGAATVFSVPVDGGAPTTLTRFTGGNGGASPYAGLTLSADGGTLYGTTSSGGTNGYGTVFSVPVTGGTPTVLTSFTGGSGGAFPYADLTLSGGTLYGTTRNGGASSYGAVFSVPVTGGTPNILASFNGGSGGAFPDASLTLSNGTLYGTTEEGGINGDGTIFSVPMDGGAPITLARFTGSNGASPYAGLTLSGGTLYGTTRNGGTFGDGTVFSVPVGGGIPTDLFSFTGANGLFPQSGLTLSADGSTLYGTTSGGGANGGGTVFSVPVGGRTPTDLFSFAGTDGSFPISSLTLSADSGTLYGTTTSGGANNYGTVFALVPNFPAAVPEASTTVSFGLLLALGMGGVVIAAWKKKAAAAA